MLDKHNRYISDENTGIEMLYKGVELSKAEFGNSADIIKFQRFASELDVNLLKILGDEDYDRINTCLLYTSPSPRDKRQSRMPSSA